MNHFMVDIETISNRPNSPILTIGAVKFDLKTGKLGDEFYVDLDVEDSFNYGTPDGGTFKWWMSQSDAARRAATKGTTKLADALNKLREFYPDWKNIKVWANSPSFDCVILEYAYRRRLQQSAPWMFWNTRDCRTISEIAGKRAPTIAAEEGVHHNALDDAKHQAKWVSDFYALIKGSGESTVTNTPRAGEKPSQRVRPDPIDDLLL